MPFFTSRVQSCCHPSFVRPVLLWIFAVVVVLGIIPATSSEARSSLKIPPPGLIEILNREHHRSDWVRITTDSGRYEARIRVIGELGLSGISPRKGAPPVPESIPWLSVERLDQVHSGSRVGRLIGGVVLGSLALPAVQSGEVEALGIVALGAAGGYWLGGHIGGHWVWEHTLYEGQPAPDSEEPLPEPPRGPSAGFAMPVATRTGSTAQPVSRGAGSERIEHSVHRLRRNQLLRIRGPLGEFEGGIVQASADGLHGLRPSDSEAGQTPWPRDIGWDRIVTIEKRGNSAGRGAIIGAVPLAVLGLVVGLVAVAGGGIGGSGSGTSSEIAAAGVGAAAVGAGVGALFGGLIGCAIPRWHQVY